MTKSQRVEEMQNFTWIWEDAFDSCDRAPENSFFFSFFFSYANCGNAKRGERREERLCTEHREMAKTLHPYYY